MKKILCFIFMVYFWSIFNGSADASDVLALKYQKPVNELEISVTWRPIEMRNGYVIGPAIIELKNVKYGGHSTLVNNHFAILNDRLGNALKWEENDEKGNRFVAVNTNTIILNYNNPIIQDGEYSFGTEGEPFFFYDIDFDGVDDLLLVEYSNGQRWVSTFRAYKLSKSQNIEVLEQDLYQITREKPFILLDGLTTVDRRNKKIKVHYSAGAVDSYSDVYALKDGEFKLEH